MSTTAWVVLASLLAGLAVVLVAWLGAPPEGSSRKERARTLPTADVGRLDFDFSKSFASNLTVVGAILTAVLGAKVLPSQLATPKPDVVMSQNGYTSLSLLFALLVVVAPFVYVALRAGVVGPDGLPKGSGRGWAFLLASWLTVWGAIGQMATVGLVFYEGKHAGTLLESTVIPVWAVLGCALVLVAYYAVKVIDQNIEQSTPKPAKEAAPQKKAAGAPEEGELALGVESVDLVTLGKPTPRWTVL